MAAVRTSVAEGEKRTGLKFFTALPEDVARAPKEEPDHAPIRQPTRADREDD